MELLKYILLVSVSSILLYGLYLLLLKNDTFLKMRRAYLLFAIFFSVLYPFCQINLSDTAFVLNEYWLPLVEVNANTQNNTEIAMQSGFDYQAVLLIVMALGVVFLLSKLLMQLVGVLKLRMKHKTIQFGQHEIICVNDENTAPFSFFNLIFLNPTMYKADDLEEMIVHEKIHISQRHTIDVLVAELFTIFFWWNPFTWLLKKEIKLNLEYLADEGVLEKGYNSKQYQYLLLQTINPNSNLGIVNNFNVSQLKKRIIMINKEKTSKLSIAKYLFAIPVIAVMILANANYVFATPMTEFENNEEKVAELPKVKDEKPFTSVEQMPRFPGGERAQMQFMGENLKYPEDAATNKIEGRVVVRFVISSIGKITDVTIIRGLSLSCDAEAIRVVEAMPDWTPGKQNGIDVPVYYTLPVLYKLKKDK